MAKPPKTEGVDWLGYSLVAFNGSGYADRNSPEDFVKSYIAYNIWKKRDNAVLLATRHQEVAEIVAESLLKGTGPGQTPSSYRLRQFSEFYEPARTWIPT